MHRDFGRVPGAEVHDEPEMLWFTVPFASSWLNGASRTNVSTTMVGAAIDRLIGEIHGREHHLLWHVGGE